MLYFLASLSPIFLQELPYISRLFSRISGPLFLQRLQLNVEDCPPILQVPQEKCASSAALPKTQSLQTDALGVLPTLQLLQLYLPSVELCRIIIMTNINVMFSVNIFGLKLRKKQPCNIILFDNKSFIAYLHM